MPTAAPATDVVVVGAGVVGLAHAAEAVRRGLSVTVVERDERPVGASVQNFGHIGVTAQAGTAAAYARRGRTRWLEVGAAAGFWVGETGAVVVARADDELAVLREAAAERDGEIVVLDAAAVTARVPVLAAGIVGGAELRLDLRVDPRRAVPILARWLAAQPGVRFSWSTTVNEVEADGVRTSRGIIGATSTVVCVGHDLDRVLPDVAAAAGMARCTLRMLRVAAPDGTAMEPAVLSGTSLLRYGAFACCPSLGAVRDRLRSERPGLLDAVVNLMLTQLPDGDLVLGDTHRYASTPDPFDDEALDALLLDEGARLLGAGPLAVRERWRGVYASAAGDFVVAAPHSRARVVSVTSGIGMTTAFGLAADVADGLSW